MGKVLKINLGSQREIKQEGVKKSFSDASSTSLPVGKIRTNFFLPELKLNSEEITNEKISPSVQKVVSRINKFIENIADDYFLLGLHLISLHSLLKESKLTIEQIKSWYLENINMPYSSAMQCRKVAEVYSENPELIGRYTASGAYLLSGCKNPEEREEIWQEAKGIKNTPSIRDIREALKIARARKVLAKSESDEIKKEKENSSVENLISPIKIRESLEAIIFYSENYLTIEKEKEREEMRKILVESVKKFLGYFDEKV